MLLETEILDLRFQSDSFIPLAQEHQVPVGMRRSQALKYRKQTVKSLLGMQSSDAQQDSSASGCPFRCRIGRSGFGATCRIGDHMDRLSWCQLSAPVADGMGQNDLGRAERVGPATQPSPDPTRFVVPGVDSFRDDHRVCQAGGGLESQDVHAVDEADDCLGRS